MHQFDEFSCILTLSGILACSKIQERVVFNKNNRHFKLSIGGNGSHDNSKTVSFCFRVFLSRTLYWGYCIVLYCILKASLEASGAADLFLLEKTRSWNFEHAKMSKSDKKCQNE